MDLNKLNSEIKAETEKVLEVFSFLIKANPNNKDIAKVYSTMIANIAINKIILQMYK